MTTRIAATFAQLNAAQKTAFIPYLMAGDPSADATVALMHALAEHGADVLELGFPFSDPTADGAAIQAAGERALQAGMTLHHTLKICTEFRTKNTTTPIILMGYANPVMQFGYEGFADALHASGVDGIILVDLPPEEEDELLPFLNAHSIAIVRLVAPTTEGERLKRLLATAGGFVYVISIKGITGTHAAEADDIQMRIAEIRAMTALPIVAGFGIRTAAQAAALKGIADGVVIGSALVEALHSSDAPLRTAADFASEVANALH
jgi:tryptophan synthase alpha chain